MRIPERMLWLALVLSLLGVAKAQENAPGVADPGSVDVQVRVVSATDGIAVPGVPILVDEWRGRVPETVRDGWVIADERRHASLPRIRAVSDPDGIVKLTLAAGREHQWSIQAASPFAGKARKVKGGLYELQVTRGIQARVKVVDAHGKALPDYAVALRARYYEQQITRTDRTGHATFTLNPNYEARLTVCPAGWLGPTDGMPTVAPGLSRKVVTLHVPPHGRLRITAVRGEDGGLAQPTRVTTGFPRNGSYKVDVGAAGVEFVRVATGARVSGQIESDNGNARWSAVGPAPGEVKIVEVKVYKPGGPLRVTLDNSNMGMVKVREPRKSDVVPTHGELPVFFKNAPVDLLRGAKLDLIDAKTGRVRSRLLCYPRQVNQTIRCVVHARAGSYSGRIHVGGATLATIDHIEIHPKGHERGFALRPIDLEKVVRGATVTVVDGEGIPIAGATLQVSDAQVWYRSDERGELGVWLPTEPTQLWLRAKGFRSRCVKDLQHGDKLVLKPEQELSIEMVDVPKAWPRDRLAVSIRPAKKGEGDGWQQELFTDGDRVELEMPPPGRYVVRLLVRNGNSSDNSMNGRLWPLHEGEFVIDEAQDPCVQFTVPAKLHAAIEKYIEEE